MQVNRRIAKHRSEATEVEHLHFRRDSGVSFIIATEVYNCAEALPYFCKDV
jgi:hypothetical protein